MPQVKTGEKCVICKKGEIVAEVAERVAIPPLSDFTMGPGSNYKSVTYVASFHCDNCQIVYNYPPGKPEAEKEVLKKLEPTPKDTMDEVLERAVEIGRERAKNRPRRGGVIVPPYRRRPPAIKE